MHKITAIIEILKLFLQMKHTGLYYLGKYHLILILIHIQYSSLSLPLLSLSANRHHEWPSRTGIHLRNLGVNRRHECPNRMGSHCWNKHHILSDILQPFMVDDVSDRDILVSSQSQVLRQ